MEHSFSEEQIEQRRRVVAGKVSGEIPLEAGDEIHWLRQELEMIDNALRMIREKGNAAATAKPGED